MRKCRCSSDPLLVPQNLFLPGTPALRRDVTHEADKLSALGEGFAEEPLGNGHGRVVLPNGSASECAMVAAQVFPARSAAVA